MLDTVYLVALLRKRDPYRDRARQWHRHLLANQIDVVVTEAVLWEWLNACAEPAYRMQAAAGYHRLHHDEGVQVIPFEPARVKAAVELYESRPDKAWSQTDCFSFVVMQEMGLIEALTLDRHFEQAGYRALMLREPPE